MISIRFTYRTRCVAVAYTTGTRLMTRVTPAPLVMATRMSGSPPGRFSSLPAMYSHEPTGGPARRRLRVAVGPAESAHAPECATP